MWRRLRILMVCLVVMLVATPSANAGKIKDRIIEKIRFERFTKTSHLSTSGMNLWAEIDNGSCHRVTIHEAEIDITIKGRTVATITLRDKVVLPRRSTTEVLLPLRFTSRSSLAFTRLLWKIVDGLGDDIYVTYRAKAGIPLFKTTIYEFDIPVTEILTNFAISKLRLRELLDML